MGDGAKVPEGWAKTTLGNITKERGERVGRDSTPRVLSSTKHRGLVPSDEYFKGRTIYSDDISAYKRVCRNWFAYATNHLAEGSIGLQADLDVGCVSPIYTVFSCTEGVDPRFLFRLLKSPPLMAAYQVHEQASVDRRGAVRYQDFAKISVMLPPLAEQWRIAGILDSVDESICLTERLIEKQEAALSGLLSDVFERGVDRNGAMRLDLGIDNVSGDGISADWRHGPAIEFCHKITVGVVNSATWAYVASGIPFLRSQNVRPGRILLNDLLHVSGQFNQLHSKSVLRAGDVVIVRTGQPGTAAVIPRELDGANCFSLVVARPREELDPRFLALYLNSEVGRSIIARTHFGSAQHNFNVAEMRRLPLLVPPLDEQHRILSVASAAELAIERDRAQVRKLRQVKQGLMEDLLTGRVRVPVEGA